MPIPIVYVPYLYTFVHVYTLFLTWFFLNPPRKTVGDWVPFLGVLGLLQAVLWCAMMWSESHVQQVSRRFANLSYIVWIVSTLYVIIYVNAMKSGSLFYDSVLELWKKNFISQIINFDQYANL